MSKKTIWIMNHYATNMFFDKGGRHYWFAENLLKNGYEPTIFCANTRHNSGNMIVISKGKYSRMTTENIPFVFVKTVNYSGNGIQRINNMLMFAWNLFSIAKEYSRNFGKPDVILASSVHPLTLVAGIKIARKFGVPCICEIRDLWPESLVAYGFLKRDSIIAKLLYKGEKWIYKNADSIIMTWEGGKEYISDQGWDKHIDLNKVKYINNGVSVEKFDRDSIEHVIKDKDLENNDLIKIVYTGSVRKVNNIGLLLDAAKIIQDQGYAQIRILIYGSGEEREILEKRCKDENINNVIFKGQIEKRFVPSVLKKADINVLHNSSTVLDKYGQSQNKLFEYLAAGKCIIQTYSTGFSILKKYNCGICVPVQNAEEIAKALIKACNDKEQYKIMGANARQASYEYDFQKLTNELINIINSL
ncbi:MAG TPA: glycosyltransferase family 4 protein [Bacillota bacterium]|nr:glycosyltransferase family 4 protein [Bacillota bacterium]